MISWETGALVGFSEYISNPKFSGLLFENTFFLIFINFNLAYRHPKIRLINKNEKTWVSVFPLIPSFRLLALPIS